MSCLFEPAFLARQQAVYPALDVFATVGAVSEYASRHHVANPKGLLVHWLRKQERERRARVESRERDQAADMNRYAEFWIALLGRAATRRLSPGQVARCIEAARRNGFAKLNAQLEARLHVLEASGGWPDGA